MARHSAADRFTRLLALPAWVAEHDGVSVARAAEHFGVSVKDIERDVNTLWVSGLPGGMPGDLVDFSAEDFEAGYLSLSQPLGLDRPVRLTRHEATSLLLSLRVLSGVLADDEAAVAALSSTQRALADLLAADDEAHGGSPLPQSPEPGAPAPEEKAEKSAGSASPESSSRAAGVLAAVNGALREGRRLHLAYVSATDTRSERDVDPIEIRSDGSHMTLRAWCLSAGTERSFRLDRIERAQVLETPAVRHRSPRRRDRSATGPQTAALAPSGPDRADERPRATLSLRPTGRWLVEQVPHVTREDASRTPSDQDLHVVVTGRDRAWLIGLVLSAGKHLIAVEPQDLAREAAAVAARALSNY